MALENNLVGGVFLYSLVDDYHIHYIQSKGLPVVVIGNRPVYLPVSRVSVDYQSISYEVTKALLNASSETVHFFTAPFILYYEHQILEGYLQACRDADRDTSVRMYDYTQKDAARLRHAILNVDDNSGVMLNYNIGYLMGDSDQVFPLDLRNLRAAAFGTSYGINPSILRRLNVRDSDKDSSGEAAVELMEEAIAGAAPREIVLVPEILTYEEEGLLRINVNLVRSGGASNE
jgi:DNA-binding LacI/PurR family transcriptional regulator